MFYLTYGKPVDGIVTFADTYWLYIAKVAQQFGLPTCAPEGFKIATNKYLTSEFVGHDAHRACSADDALDISYKHNLQYPLIVKPCDGWSSEGVSRVDSPEVLALAIK
ncbi:fumipyrrole biosynthesis protein C [Trichophyton mentagrophytes]|nr:fumipyrrole biosynthesis protein C [Trichophyton mentagrophytes]